MKKILWLIVMNFLVLVIIVTVFFAGAELYLRAKNSSPAKSFTAVGLPIYQKSDELTWEHKPEASLPEYPAGSGEPLEINCRGERGEQCREPGPIDSILMMGDSFTFGINAKQSAIFPVLLDKKLGINTDVRNQGTIGYTLDQYAAYLNKNIFGPMDAAKINGSSEFYKPDLVVLNIFVGNDITELRRHEVLEEKNNLPLRVKDAEVFVGDDGTLQSYSTPQPKSLAWYKLAQMFRAVALKTGAQKITKPTLTWPVFLAYDNPAQDPNLEDYWRNAENLIVSMNSELTKRGIQFLVVFIPMDVQVSHSYWSKYPGMPFDEEAFAARRPQTNLNVLCNTNGVLHVDLLPMLQADAKKDELYFAKDDTHFTEYGHQRVAEILELMVRELL